MASNADTAEAIIRIYAKQAAERHKAWLTYGELAALLGRPGQQRLLQASLDLGRERCRDSGLPDVPVMIVSQESVKAGTLLPADGAIGKYGGLEAIRRSQAEVLSFDWTSLAI